MAEGNYKEMDKEFSLDDFDPKPVEKTTKQEETEPENLFSAKSCNTGYTERHIT